MMTMLTIYAQNPKEIELYQVTDVIETNHKLWTDIRKIEKYNGEAGLMGCAGIAVEAHISEVNDVVQTLERLMDMKVVLVW